MTNTLLHDKLGLDPGNYVVRGIYPEHWGARITFDILYRYPPLERPIRLVFEDCRSLDWYMQKPTAAMQQSNTTPLLTHDLGLPDYVRTARFATTLVEIIVSYRTLTIATDDDKDTVLS